jgi:V/A-type H+-transporting ATPase subunit C
MSDGAIAAKARAMFGSRLSEEDYMKLLQKKSVSELAYTLKHDTYFSETLAGINEKGIHRGALETLLKMDVFTRLKKLLLYADDDQAGFIYAAVMNAEEQLILMCIRAFTEGDEQGRSEMIQRMPIYIEKYLVISHSEAFGSL